MKLYTITRSIKDENYLSNSYRRLTRSKIIHLLLLLIDIFLILFHEVDILHRGFKPREKVDKKKIISPILFLIKKIDKFPEFVHFLLTIIPLLIFDIIYLFLCKNDIRNRNILLYIIINFFELFYNRLYVLLFFSLLFSLTKMYFNFAFILFFVDLYLKIFNILHSHLYFYVPKFVDYPYDEFSSRYDIYLLLSKFIIAIAGVSKIEEVTKFCFFVDCIIQLYYCFYFINKLFFHSYLFMKNSFLNKSRLSLFFGKTIILFLSYINRNNNIFSIIYFIISIDAFLIMGIIYFIYDPFSHIYISSETPLKNIFFLLNIINEKKDIEILVENQIVDHYNDCRFCNLCLNYFKYRKEQINNPKEIINENGDEKDTLIINQESKILDLFYILYDGKIKYFEFIVKLVINYKKYGKNSFNNNSSYYINLSSLIYFDYKNKNSVLALNEKIILEIINEENKSFLENHHIQIKQLILFNKYFSLIKNILNLLNEILNGVNNFDKIENLINLSKLLKEMKSKKYKKYIFNRKYKNITNSSNNLLACSILYEEILNKTINHNIIPIRESNELLEEFSDISDKNCNSNITLKFDLINYNFIIIRTGKELSSFLNVNFFDLFPNAFKHYQKDILIDLIYKGFNDKSENIDENDKNKIIFDKKKKFKNEFIESKFIIFETISNHTFYKLLYLKLRVLFNNENNNYILFNGTYSFNKNTIVTVIDITHKKDIEEKILGFSNLWVEKNLEKNSFSIKDYNKKNMNEGHQLVKLFSYQILVHTYNIYNIERKTTVVMKRRSTIGDITKFAKIAPKKNKQIKEEEENEDEEIYRTLKNNIFEDIENSTKKINRKKEIYIEDKKKNKRETINNYNTGLNRIRKIINISIILILVIIIIEYFLFYRNNKEEFNGNISFNNFNHFFRLYNQLFSSMLSVVCIPEKIDSQNCRNYISIFNDAYSKSNPEENFNFSEYLLVQNKILSRKLMEQKSNIMKIREYLGTKIYNKLFNTEMKYIQINKEYPFNINIINLRFFDAILIVCNSFRILTENETIVLTEPIYFLNKTETPFVHLYNQLEMPSYQEEVYNMILNYNFFSQQIERTNQLIINHINKKKVLVRFLIYFFLNVTTILFLIISLFIYFYIIFFNKIIIIILNQVINTMNMKDDKFDFIKTFSKKLENLEAILEIYKVNPLETIKNLNSIYKKYSEYLNDKKVIINEKKYNSLIYKKEKQKKEIVSFYEFQKIVSENDINQLKINKKNIYCLITIVILIIILYVFFLISWIDFFLRKSKLNDIIEKNSNLEKTCYEAINMYQLMIFNNYTINEIVYHIYLGKDKKQAINEHNFSNIIFNNFYKVLYLLFDSKKDQKYLGNLYQSFEDLNEFNCINLYTVIKYELLEELSQILYNKNLKQKLVNICKISYITASNDIKTIFERHFQFIKNGMVSLTDFSYEGLNKNLNTTLIGRISFFFFSTTIYIIEIAIYYPGKNSINNIKNISNNKFLLMEISFIIFGVILIIIIFFFYFYNINGFCKQIFLLKKAFNISKM